MIPFPLSLEPEKNPQIGMRVLWLRRERGWAQKQLATAAEVHIESIVRLEKGRHVKTSCVETVAKALGVTLEYLYSPLA